MQNQSTHETEKPYTQHFLFRLVVVGLITLIYYLAGRFGLTLAFVNPSATAVWPPTGIALAAFLVLGDYVAPGILLGAFLVNLATSDSVLFSLPKAIGSPNDDRNQQELERIIPNCKGGLVAEHCQGHQ